MKEELLKNLAGIIEYVKQGVDFAKEQAPLFVQEFITFKTSIYLFYEIFSVIVIIVCGIIFVKGYKRLKEDEFDDYGFPMCLFSGLVGVAFVVIFCCFTELLFEVYFAPRVFVVEKLLEFLK